MDTVKTRASVLHGAKDLCVEERTLPPLQTDEVRVAVRATGLCGSDLHYFAHFRNGDILVREPLTLGHESAGVITAIPSTDSTSSPSTSGLKVGDRVALEVGLPCGDCELCLAGRYNICKGMKFRSSAKANPHAQGTLQEEIVHPAKWCHKLPDDMPLEMGALLEPFSVALHASDRAQMKEDASVLVFGAGAVGLLCAAISKVVVGVEEGNVTGRKRRKVVIADINKDRVDFAVQNGFADAGVVVPAPQKRPVEIEEKLAYAKDVAEITSRTKVDGKEIGEVDGAYECTGVESCLQTAIYATKPGGRVMIIGMGNPIQTLPISAASLREVDLVGVFRYADTYPRVIELLASKNPTLPPLEMLITHRYKGLDSIPDAFKMAAKVKDDEGKLVLKVMVDM